jgi:uncharacterized membrane protein YgcG
VKKILVATFAALVVALPLSAQERIKSYNSVVEIHVDGSIDVTENISVHAEGHDIRRGIYRDFPTIYKDRIGNGFHVGFDVISVERNGVTEPWFTEQKPNGIRVNTGNDNYLPVPADYTYTFKFHTTRQLGFFPDHDELYWNAIGTGWMFPIESGVVEVHLPVPVPIAQMHAEGYTGSQGSKGNNYEAELTAPGVATYRLAKPLEPYEGLTIVLTFPKGIVIPPTGADKTRSLLEDNRGVLIAIVGLFVALFYMVTQWQRVGRDPKKGIVIARYEPSAGHSPAGLRYMQLMAYDMKCFTGDVLALAVAGRLRIHQEKHFFGDQWSLERTQPESPSKISAGQQALLAGLFPGGEDTLILKNSNASIMSAARMAHIAVLGPEYQPEYFNKNNGKVVLASVIAVVFAGGAQALSNGYGTTLITIITVLMIVSAIIFKRLICAPTLKGRALLDEIEGFELYMTVAEKQELASMRGPNEEPVLDAKRYEALLPYAVALQVEDAWTKKFTDAAGAAAAAAAANNMGWYHGSAPISSLGNFSNAIGSSLSSSISSAATAPGSSSGSGGGGSSGGGGGGGGGGGR